MYAHSSSTRRPQRFLFLALTSLLLLSTLLATPLATAATPQPDAAQRAADWLTTQQLPDGGFASFGGGSDASATADALVALAAAGPVDANVLTRAIDYLDAQVPTALTNPGQLAKIILARIAVGLPASPDNTDLPAAIIASANAQGWYGNSFYGHIVAVMALDAADVDVPASALNAITAAQAEDGGWGFNGDTTLGTTDTNSTALAVMTLIAVHGATDAPGVAAGLDYLSRLQTPDGSMPYDQMSAEFGGDANSTALAIQAFIAAGQDPDTLANGSLVDALLTFQNDSGAFAYQSSFPDDSLLATVQAIPAALLLPLPVIGEPQVVDPVDPALVAAVQPADALADCVYYDVTSHNVCGEIATYWAANGGLPIFGYPLSEVVTLADGRTVQYFERAVLGLHLEWADTPYVVLPTLIGSEAAARDGVDTTPAGDANNGNCTYFAETQHNLCGGFRAYWENQGGLFVYGFPLTEEFALADGTVVQYFERVRLEWRPGQWPERWDTLLTRLGAEQLERDLNPNLN